MQEIVIVTGGNREINHYRKLLSTLDSPPLVIGVDAGAYWLYEHKQPLDLAVGDFDSIDHEKLSRLQKESVDIQVYNPEKDETDTDLAVRIALLKNPGRMIIYGGLGNRFDHSLANVQLLYKCLQKGIFCEIIDPSNRIRLIDQCTIIENHYPFISLVPFTERVEGITLTGFKYPLLNATIGWGSSLGISNELISKQGSIEIRSGMLLVIESKDD